MKKFNIIIAIIAIVILAIIGYFALSQSSGPQISADTKIVDANALTEKGILKLSNKTQDEDKGLFKSNASDENSIY